MPQYIDLGGTTENLLKIGDRVSGFKSIAFDNGNLMEISGNPSTARSIAFPDESGSVLLERLYVFWDTDFSIPLDATHVHRTGVLTQARTITLPDSAPTGKQIVVENLGQDYAGLIPLNLSSALPINHSDSDFRISLLCDRVVCTRTSVGWKVSEQLIESSYNQVVYRKHFVGNSGVNEQYLTAVTANSGTVTISSASGFGVLSTASNTSGRASLTTASTGIRSNTLEPLLLFARVYIPTLSDTSNRFLLTAGFADSITTPPTGVGFFFRYSHDVNSGNWTIFHNSASVDTGIAVGVNTWYDLGIFADSVNVYYLINGLVVSTQARPLMVALSCGLSIGKTAGTASREFRVRATTASFPVDLIST